MERDNLLHFVSMFWNGSLTNGIILIYLAVRTAKLVIYHTRKSGSDSIFLVNPIALRRAETLLSFCLSECHRVNSHYQ